MDVINIIEERKYLLISLIGNTRVGKSRFLKIIKNFEISSKLVSTICLGLYSFNKEEDFFTLIDTPGDEVAFGLISNNEKFLKCQV